MAPNLNGPPTIILIHPGGPFKWPQFKWAFNNNIDPGGPGLLNLIFANQLRMPRTIIFKWPQFKLAPNNNIVSKGPDPFNLMSANQFKRTSA